MPPVLMLAGDNLDLRINILGDCRLAGRQSRGNQLLRYAVRRPHEFIEGCAAELDEGCLGAEIGKARANSVRIAAV